MVETMMLDNLEQYKDYLVELKAEHKKHINEIKTIEKAKKTISKLEINGIEFSVPQDNKKEEIEQLEKEIKLLTSIIRRYTTLLNL